jgi:tetratricopeptide (TPR) repeat protein
MVAVSAQKEQMSARAQSQYAVNLFNAGRPDESVQVLDRAIANIGTNRPQLLITRLIVLCNLHRLAPAELAYVGSVIGPQPYDPRYLKFYTDLAQAITERRCPAVDLAHLRPMFQLMLESPENVESDSVSLSHIHYLLGYVDVKSGAREEAMKQFYASLGAHPDADSAMTMAALMATAGFGEEALSLSEKALDYVDLSTRGMRLGTNVSKSDILEFQEVVRADLESGSN